MNFPQFWAKAESGDFARSRRCNLAFIGLAVIPLTCGLALPVFGSPQPSEPEYQGMRLSDWLAMKPNGGYLHAGAEEAVRQIGTNAFPTLLQMLRAQDSPFKLKLMDLSKKQHVIHVHWVSAGDQYSEACAAFIILQGSASNAVPGLIQVYEEKVSDTSQALIAFILFHLGPAADAAVPALAKTLADTNASADLRWQVEMDLGMIHLRPKLVVPLLINGLSDPDKSVRREAAFELWQYGKDAKTAVPALKKMLKDPDPDMRDAASSAIKNIEGDVATVQAHHPTKGRP